MLLTAVISTNNYKLQHVIGFYQIFPHVLHKKKEQQSWVWRLQFNGHLVCFLSSHRFITTKGIKICVSSNQKWVQTAMKKIDQKHAIKGK